MSPLDNDAENVVRYLQSPKVAIALDRLLNEKLTAIEGYEAIPPAMRHRIWENAKALYFAGYLHAVQRPSRG